MDAQGAEGRIARLRRGTHVLAGGLVETFHYLGLFAIGGATVWGAVFAFAKMTEKGAASIEDLMLLFIYLEIGAMVGIYFKTNHMPVRFLLYIAITALTRHLVAYVNTHEKPELELLIIAGAIFVLAMSVLAIRYGSYWFSSDSPIAESQEKPSGPIKRAT